MEINDVLLKLGSFATDIFPFRKAPFLLGVQKSVHHRVVNTKHTLAIFSEREKKMWAIREKRHSPSTGSHTHVYSLSIKRLLLHLQKNASDISFE